MSTPLCTLIIEDSTEDAKRMIDQLRELGFSPDWKQIENQEDSIAALDRNCDLILADSSMPELNPLQVVQLLQERGLNIPIIVITDDIRQETVTHWVREKRIANEKQQVQQLLRESEDRYRQLTRMLPEAIALVCENQLIEINPAGVKLLGASTAEELLGKTAQELGLTLQPQSLLNIDAPTSIELMRVNGTAIEVEVRVSACIYNQKPAIQWVFRDISAEEKVASGVLDDRGESGSVLSPSQDRSDRDRIEVSLKQAKKELERRVAERTAALKDSNDRLVLEIVERTQAEKSLRKHLAAIEASMDGIAIIDRNRKFVYLNQAYAKLYAYDRPQELLGQHWTIVCKDTELERFEQIIVPELHTSGQWRGIAIGTRRDRTQFHQEMSLTALEEENVVCVVRDIRDRMVNERALQEARDQLQAVLDAVPGSVAWISSDLRYLGVNQYLAELFNLSPEEFLGQEIGFIKTSPGFGEFIRDFFANQNTQASQEIKMQFDSGIRNYLIVAKKYNDGKAAVSVGIEITNLKRLEVELRQSLEQEKKLAELKSRFVSMTSHEFRTPLTTIQSSAELIEYYSHLFSEEKKLKHLHRIKGSVKRMTELLEDVLIIGKAESGKLEFNPTELDLEKFCGDLVEEMQLSDRNKHELTFVTCQGIYNRPCMDRKLLRHILVNLLSNALKYSPKGTPVNFSLACRDNQAQFTIQDYGIGIPPEDLIHLFETFHRASNVGDISGTGLGMAIVKNSVDLHKGQIAVESKVGIGTIFRVTLPLNQ